MQAILRWDKEHGDSFEPQPRPRLSLQRKHDLLKAVRALQRCRSNSHWPQYLKEFEASVKNLCKGSTTSANDILSYFHANWFTEEWKGIFLYFG